ncbi:HAD family hydrolase [Roseibium aggregatum]|uniref:Haloacid dehalogenase-like hydrolase n=1 Tax=Roseibium aggregatum TaxID=187304 RepID=A0A926S4G1_9HYPH|nr:HAD family hydrolase [Roseibium aggregatum]MBD1546353.1 haloacid dehalogenase-like hydrolase [Roseibium aggregatum]
MNTHIRKFLVPVLALAAGITVSFSAAAQSDPLPSWNDGANKQAIIAFVDAVTTQGGADFVAPGDRIATFDNDGTLWVEHPIYTQLAFAFDRVMALAPQHPEWKTTQPFQAVLEGDMEALGKSGMKGLMEIVGATHAGMSTAEFEKTVSEWIATAKHPKFDKLYTGLVYQPMLELMDYLRANGFRTFIVSGGGIEFMRPWTEKIYGIPPEQVVGSSIVVEYKVVDGVPSLMRSPKIAFIDDKEGKPVGILTHIGKRPTAAFGNSDGDYQMLQWTTAGPGKRLGMIVHHDDADREYAYDRKTHVGTLDKAMDDAPKEGWHLISMKNDWKQIFPE